MATDMTASGSPEEKLRWAFKMYDKDGSGRFAAKIFAQISHKLGLKVTLIVKGKKQSLDN